MADHGGELRQVEYYGALHVPFWRGADGSMTLAHGTPEMDTWLATWRGVLSEVEARLDGTPPDAGG